jgi:tricorn protease
MDKVYLLTLAKDTESPFEPENDVVEVKEDENGGDDKKENGKKEVEEKDEEGDDIKVDFDGIEDRVLELPVDVANYWNIKGVDGGAYYQRFKTGDKQSSLLFFDLKSKKETDLGNVNMVEISANGKKVLVSQRGKYAVIDLPKGKVKLDKTIDLSGMKVWVAPKDEWKQIFDESWRQMRDFFYDPNMHGVDWDKVYKKYEPLVKYANTRYDLSYIIGEMIGEVSTGHAYISGGDRVVPEKIKTGLLGAELSRDKSGYYRIDHMLKGQNWDKSVRSPLTEIGVNVNEGDYIIAVNGQPTSEMVNIYQSFVGMAGKQVELTISSSASDKDIHNEIVLPISDESKLYYYEWISNNIKKVDEATNGQVGYIHIPDMGPAGLNQFVKYFYPQMRKKALIIDDRGNGGGNVSPMIIERLRRELSLMGMGRNTGGNPTPGAMMLGPMVCLINQYSASDGDLFPYQFRRHNLGKLIGTRTWGGVVGIRGSLPFIDGSDLRKPEYAHYSADGSEWIIEGRGVKPDIEVINDPAQEFEGIDQQLNKAIEVLLDELQKNPKEYPELPPFPDKSK